MVLFLPHLERHPLMYAGGDRIAQRVVILSAKVGIVVEHTEIQDGSGLLSRSPKLLRIPLAGRSTYIGAYLFHFN